MKINISISLLNKLYNNILYIIYLILLLLITIFIVIIVTKKLNFNILLYSLLLYTLLLIIFDSLGHNILSISLPSVIQPYPTNLGLDGISHNIKNIGI